MSSHPGSSCEQTENGKREKHSKKKYFAIKTECINKFSPSGDDNNEKNGRFPWFMRMFRYAWSIWSSIKILSVPTLYWRKINNIPFTCPL